MNFSLTGISYFTLFLSLSFLAFRFFQYWRKERTLVSRLFFFFVLTLLAFALARAVSGLFFFDDMNALLLFFPIINFLQGLAAAIVVFLVIHLKFPKTSPWLGFWSIFILGSIAAALTGFLNPARPFLEENGSINWGLYASLEGIFLPYFILRISIILISFLPLILILCQQFSNAREIYFKIRSLGLILILIIGIAVGLLDFLLIDVFGLQAINRDIALIILSILLFFVILFTQRPEGRKME